MGKDGFDLSEPGISSSEKFFSSEEVSSKVSLFNSCRSVSHKILVFDDVLASRLIENKINLRTKIRYCFFPRM